MALLTYSTNPVQAQVDRGNLEGWGPFRFDMSFEEAKSAAGLKAIQPTDSAAGKISDMPSHVLHYDTTIGDMPFKAVVEFAGQGDRISSIGLNMEGVSSLDPEACLETYNRISALLVEKYGSPDVAATKGTVPGRTHYKLVASYKFSNGAIVSPTIIVREKLGGFLPIDCAVGVSYAAPQVRTKETF